MCFIKELESACQPKFKEVVNVEFTIDEHQFIQEVFFFLHNYIVDNDIDVTNQFHYLFSYVYDKVNDADIKSIAI